jgi:hypothetical protein
MQILNVSISGGLNLELTPLICSVVSNVSTIVEGNTFTITFTTNRPGVYPYTITGINTNDISNDSLTGSFTANGETRTYTVTEDSITEGRETFLMTLDNGLSFVPVGIDDSYYTLTANVASANEGNVFSVALYTNAIHALPLGYTITGVSNVDFNGSPPLTGNFTANGQVLTYTANLDATTEGTEYFAISLNNGRANANITINDTSTPYYILTANVASVNEGNSFTVTFLTNAIHELPLGYTITGVSNVDFNGSPLLTGNFTANGQVLTYTANSDLSAEGAEYFVLSLNNGRANANVLVNDTSIPLPGQQEFTTAGTYSWIAPTGVSSISVVAVGGGGGGARGGNPSGGAGAGGGLSWGNVSVTPGQTYTVRVGVAGAAQDMSYDPPARPGGWSAFGANTIFAGGGNQANGSSASAGGTYSGGQGGGTGGAGAAGAYYTATGGGGAGGYSGAGGAGGSPPSYSSARSFNYPGAAGAGGGGGGGGGWEFSGAGGGGVGIYGAGASGQAGQFNGQGGFGGSGGANAANVTQELVATPGGAYGGGGAGCGNGYGGGAVPSSGARGAVRIIWGNSTVTRYYPSTNTANV